MLKISFSYSRMRVHASTLALFFGALLLAACASNQPTTASKALQPAVASPTSVPQPTNTPQPPSLPEASLEVLDDPIFGQILVGNDGMALYIFTKDTPDQSNCDASCLNKWPPLLTQGTPNLGSGVDPSLVGSAALPDGSMIVTYNHMPLYYWYKDTKPGDTKGQAVGDVWYVLNPGGTPVEAALEASLNVAEDPNLGQILVGNDGMTLYIFTKDAADQSNCDANCLKNWPPLLSLGTPVLGEGVDDSKVGTATLADGTLIVTYDHMPLYYFAKDAQPGDLNGQGVGSVWFVLNPDGEVIGQ